MKETENKFNYPLATLQKFADLIVNEYKNDYDKFLIDKKAIKDGKVLDYVKHEKYYKKFVDGTDFDNADDFFRPIMPKSFWDRLYKASEKIMIAKVEDMYNEDFALTGINRRAEKLNELRKKLLTPNNK